MTEIALVEGERLDLSLPGTITPTSLDLPENLSHDDWERVGESLRLMEGAVHWWIGDWLAHGEKVYGATYDEAERLTEFSKQTLKIDKWVADRIEKFLRRNFLSWTHHKEVAALEPDDQDRWLDLAMMGDGEKPWPVSKLRNEIRAWKRQKRLEEQIPPNIEINEAILLGDCLEVPWPSEIDLIVTDPPFGLTVGEAAGVREGKGDWDEKSYAELHEFNLAWLTLCVESLKDSGSIFVFGSVHNIFSVGHILKSLGCYIVRDIVWVKPFIQRQVNLYTLAPAHELIIWARKGERHTCNLDEITRDVWEIQPKVVSGHPTEKPEEIIERIVMMASEPSELVADPFLGSGTTTAVAKRLKREYWGVEKDESWWKIATERTKNSSGSSR
jgi:site-specific DNA-methyltransferase (adenine-specific)